MESSLRLQEYLLIKQRGDMMKSVYQRNSSVSVAKHRLQNILSSDRINCSPDLINQMREDVYHTISKYVDIKPSCYEFDLTRTDIHIRYAGEK